MRFEGRPHSGLVVGDDREESQHGAVTLLPPGPVGPRCSLQLMFLFAAARLALGGSCVDSMGSSHVVPQLFRPKFPRQKSECWGPVSNPLHPPWTEDSCSEVCLLGRAVDRVVTSNNHRAGDSWCTGGRVGRQGRWGGLAGSELKGLRSGPRK